MYHKKRDVKFTGYHVISTSWDWVKRSPPDQKLRYRKWGMFRVWQYNRETFTPVTLRYINTVPPKCNFTYSRECSHSQCKPVHSSRVHEWSVSYCWIRKLALVAGSHVQSRAMYGLVMSNFESLCQVLTRALRLVSSITLASIFILLETKWYFARKITTHHSRVLCSWVWSCTWAVLYFKHVNSTPRNFYAVTKL